MRRLSSLLKALNSRSIYVREAVRSQWGSRDVEVYAWHDGHVAKKELAMWGVAAMSV